MTRLTGFILLMLLALTGCLPQAKQQSCGSGSVFNSSSRECVPITSGGSTNGVSITTRSPAVSSLSVAQTQSSASQFTVTVNDSLNQGYVIRWVLYPPTGVVFNGNPLLINSASYNLFPNSVKAGGLDIGVWTLAAEIMNPTGVSLLTSAQWVINVTGNPTPTLSYHTGAPTSSRLTTDATSTFATGVTVNDTSVTPTSWRLAWYYDGQLMKSASSSGCKAPVASGSCAFSSATTHTSFTTANALSIDDPPIQAVGPHTIRAELTNTAGTSIFDSKEWTVYVYAPNMPQITATSGPAITTIPTAIDGITILNGGFRVAGTSLYDVAQSAGAFCVTVNNYLGSGSGVLLQFTRDNGIVIGSTTFAAPPALPRVCLDDIVSVANTFSFTLSNANVGELRTISASIRDLATNTLSASVSWAVSVRPKNTPPTAAVVSPASPGVHLQYSAGVVPAVEKTYTMAVTDEDTVPDNMNIDFYFDGVLMNGANFFPGTTIVTPDCSHAPGVAPTGSARLQCTVRVPIYDTTGRINPISVYAPAMLSREYTVSARAMDQVTNGSAPQTSGTISWIVRPIDVAAVALTNSLSTIVAQDLVTPDEATQSFIADAGTPADAIVAANEGDDIQFNILVNDFERDDFRIQIERCTTPACTSFLPAIPTTLITRTTDDLGKRAIFSYNIPEDVVTGAASGTVRWRVTVNDFLPDLDTNPTPNVATNSLQVLVELNVTNVNPFPEWAGAAGATPALSPVLPATEYNVFTGMPFTLNPGVIVDDSTADGAVIQYQWQISDDAGATWNDIANAQSSILRWTPPAGLAAGGPYQFRLCLGDDGFGNDIADCDDPSDPPGPATVRFAGPWTGVVARSNTIAKSVATPTANGETASWYDATERELYKVYVNAVSATNNNIVVEKYDVATTGAMTFARALTFTTERTGDSYAATALSVVGQTVTSGGKTYRNLYISYVTQNAPSIAPRMRVRQVDITDDELNFTYEGFYESSCHAANGTYDCAATGNITATASTSTAGDLEITVSDATFDVGEYFLLHGIRLNALTTFTATVDDCEFLTVDSLNAPLAVDDIMENFNTAYSACIASTPDLRAVLNTPGYSSGDPNWAFDSYPRSWVDLDYALSLTKVGDIMLKSGTLILPFIDNLNSNRLTIANINTLDGFASGSLGDTDSVTFGQTPQYDPLVTVAGIDIAASSGDGSNLDVAMVRSTGGMLSYRVNFTFPSTFAIASTSPVLFAGQFVEKPRIATGPTATNNNVFVMAQDLMSVTKDLFFARIAVPTYTSSPASELVPFDGVHEQTRDLTDYRIRALTGNKRAALSVLTTEAGSTGDVMVSLIKPTTLASNVPMIRPIAGSAYPLLATLVSTTLVSTIDMSPAFTMVAGDVGAKAGENSRESVVILHPSGASGISSTIVNITEETAANGNISATTVDPAGRYQPAYVK